MGGPIGSVTVQEAGYIGDSGQYFLRRRMDSVGDGSGVTDMSAVADEYFITPSVNEEYVINNLRIVIQDNGNIPWNEFAATGAALAVGCLLKTKQESSGINHEVIDFFDGDAITTNANFFSLGNVSAIEDPAGISILTCDIDFKTLLGYPIRLIGSLNHMLSFEVRDDLSTLVSMEIWAHGFAGTE